MDHSGAEKHNRACLLIGFDNVRGNPRSHWPSQEMLDQVGMVISFTPITDMISGSPFSLKSDQWTDDNSTTIRLAESLMECRDSNPKDQLERYVC
jgi:ADP-ribosylglycohydrolase